MRNFILLSLAGFLYISYWTTFSPPANYSLIEKVLPLSSVPAPTLVSLPCNTVTDSLALVSFHNNVTATGWNLSQDMSTWAGVTLNMDGCVQILDISGLTGSLHPDIGNLTQIETLDLDGSNLSGTIPASIGNLTTLIDLDFDNNSFSGSIPASVGNLVNVEVIEMVGNDLTGNIPPEIGNLDNLFFLRLSLNNLSGSIPPELGNCDNLLNLWLDNNMLTDTIPASLGGLSILQVLWLDENQLVGKVPIEFQNLSNLTDFQFYLNCIDSVPDLSMLNIQPGKLRAYSNKLTFDDLLPNITALGNFYDPQDSVITDTVITVVAGTNFVFDLGFDGSVLSNTYDWFKDGLPYGAQIVGNNNLEIMDIGFADAGVYEVQVNNPNLPNLTLFSYTITIQIECGLEVVQVDTSACEGQAVVINGQTYNTGNPTDTFSCIACNRHGCDSTFIINLNVLPPQEFTVDTSICEGDNIQVQGQVFDSSNPIDTIILSGGADNGCDSIIYINLTILQNDTINLNPVLCPGTSIMVNGTVYDQMNSLGTEVMMNQAGCDSVIFVNLSFLNIIRDTFDISICADSCFTFGLLCLDSTGTYIDTFQTTAGCDSIVLINLDVHTTYNLTLQDTICEQEYLIIGVDSFNITGSYNFSYQSEFGCDSLVTIDLVVLDTSLTILTEEICANECFSLNAFDYCQAGTYFQTLTGANGCDSTLQLNLIVRDTFFTILPITICQNETYIFGDDTLSETNIYLDTFMTVFGCDSIVELQLQVNDTFLTPLTEQICQGDSFFFNDAFYAVSGTYFDTLSTINGCDSFIMLDLQVLPVLTGLVNSIICADSSVSFGGNLLNTSGIFFDTTMSSLGCDSITTLVLSVLDTSITILTEEICQGDIFVVGSDSIFQTGQTTHLFAGQNGCDSTVILNLTVNDTFFQPLASVICAGDSIFFVDTFLTEPGNYEKTLVTQQGCDSILALTLTVLDTFKQVIDTTICANEIVIYAGDTLNSSGSYPYVLGTQDGCDSTIVIELTVLDTFFTPLSDSFCEGDTFFFLQTALTQPGIYRDTLPAQNGCDSILELTLQQIDTFVVLTPITICAGEVFNYQTQDLINTGNYPFVLQGQQGCDSTIIIQLTVLDTFHTFLSEQICAGETYDFNGQTYSSTQVIKDTFQAQNGCDSMITIDLLVSDTFYQLDQETICQGESFPYQGNTYSLPGVYKDTFSTKNGCDSLFELQLSVSDTSFTAFDLTICGGELYEIGDSVFTQTGMYRVKLFSANQNGCDSTVQVNLTVTDEATFGAAYAGEDRRICADTFNLNADPIPPGTQGEWLSDFNSVEFEDPNAAQIYAVLEDGGPNRILWTLSTSQCPNYSVDTLFITREMAPIGFDDYVLLPYGVSDTLIDVADNDLLIDVSEFEVFTLSQPALGDITPAAANTQLYYQYPNPLDMDQLFAYQICNVFCPELCDSAIVRIVMEPEPEPADSVSIPNAITPNGDGLNDVWVFEGLEPLQERYPNNNLVIFNRWGNVVYETSPYLDDWDGKGMNGQLLPEGTYYYLFRLTLDKGKIYKGDVTILR